MGGPGGAPGRAEVVSAPAASPRARWGGLGRAQLGTWLWRVACAALFGLAVADLSHKPFNHDVAWLLLMAERWLDGARLYVDVIDVNPPLIVYLSALIVAAARALGASLHAVLSAAVLGTVLCSAALVNALGCRDSALGKWERRAAVLALLCFGAFAQRYDWGQREQWAVFMMVPYVALAALRAGGGGVGWKSASGLGILLGLAVCFKPYFIFPCLAVELWLALRGRPGAGLRAFRRPEIAAALAVGVAFAASVAIGAPAYLLEVVPRAVRFYGAYQIPLGDVLVMEGEQRGLSVAVLVIAALAARPGFWGGRAPRPPGLLEAVAAAGLGFYLGYLVQRKGWPYHFYPVQATAVLAAALLVARGAGDCLRGRVPRGGALVGCFGSWLLLHAGPAIESWREPPPRCGSRASLIQAIREHAEEESFYMLSTSLVLPFPSVNLAGATWPYRYNALWPLPGLIATPGAAARDEERRFVAELLDELREAPPRLLAIDRQEVPQAFSSSFDFEEYFCKDPDFRRFSRGYRLLDSIDQAALFVRRPGADRQAEAAESAPADLCQGVGADPGSADRPARED